MCHAISFAGLPEYCRRAEAERVQARRITTLYAGSLIWAEKDSASGDSSAGCRLLQPDWRRVFYRMEWAVLGRIYAEPFSGAVPGTGTVEKMGDAAADGSDGAYRRSITVGAERTRGCRRAQVGRSFPGKHRRLRIPISDAVPLGRKTACGIDCSGLAFMSYFRNGILIWRDAPIKEGYPVHEIPIEQTKPGDLLFFRDMWRFIWEMERSSMRPDIRKQLCDRQFPVEGEPDIGKI